MSGPRRRTPAPEPYAIMWRFPAPDAHPRAADDDVGRLLLFAELAHAERFASRVRARSGGLEAVPALCPPLVALDLLETNGVPYEDIEGRVVVVEAQTTGPADCARWCDELADGLVGRLADAFAEFLDRRGAA